MVRARPLFLLSLVLSAALVFAEPAITPGEIRLGREAGWKDFPVQQSVGFQKLADGSLDLTLASAEYQSDPETDLLLHFDQRLMDEARHYRVAGSAATVHRGFAALGGGCAVFPADQPLTLIAGPDALWAPGRGVGDFTIEFWLYPARGDDGETIMEWTGSRTSSGHLETQDLRVSFENSHLVWTLQNLFAVSPALPAVTIRLEGQDVLIPEQWHHHLLRYRASTGVLEYLVDNETEAVAYATPSGTEDGHPMAAVLGRDSPGQLILGGSYAGALDELRISQRWVDHPQLDRYLANFAQQGTVISRVFDLGFPDSTVRQVKVRASTQGDTAIVWSYRMANVVRYQWSASGVTEQSLAAPQDEQDSWIRFTPGEDLTRRASGRYLQLRVDLLPSGTGTETPRVNQMIVMTRPSPPPPAPRGFQAVSGDGQITLSWLPVLQGSPEGYLVFFGPRPGETQGTPSTQGASPLKVGNVTQLTLTGLRNDQIYYVSVAAYRSTAVGPLSVELTARPQRKIDGQ